MQGGRLNNEKVFFSDDERRSQRVMLPSDMGATDSPAFTMAVAAGSIGVGMYLFVMDCGARNVHITVGNIRGARNVE